MSVGFNLRTSGEQCVKCEQKISLLKLAIVEILRNFWLKINKYSENNFNDRMKRQTFDAGSTRKWKSLELFSEWNCNNTLHVELNFVNFPIAGIFRNFHSD